MDGMGFLLRAWTLARRIAATDLDHLWHDDTESCIHLAIPKFETAARAQLIELDEGIYRAEAANAPGGYPRPR